MSTNRALQPPLPAALRPYEDVMKLLAAFSGPNCEVVLHDIGAVKALEHLLESGAIDHFPKIVALQSEYCDPLLKARELGLDAPVAIDVKPTIAEGIAIGKPLRGSELLEMMKKHDITVVAAPEDKILAARAKIARAGLYIEHTTAANFAAWDHYCELYGPSTDVLITLCGAGIKSDH